MYPLGHSINGSPHSVCVSLPTMKDVIGYEEKSPEVMGHMRNGYPRFVRNELIGRLTEKVAQEARLNGRELFLTADAGSASELLAWIGKGGELFEGSGFFGAHIPAADQELYLRAKRFLQHTGSALSSREAEDALGLEPFAEETLDENPDLRIREQLAHMYRARSADDIYLCRGGMNAFYAGFKVIRDLQAKRGRNVWIQLGWLYVDTLRILECMTGGVLLRQYNVCDMNALEVLLEAHSGKVAGIVTEVPTNPLIETCDVLRLHRLSRKHGAALILDPTIASPHNVNILPLSDVHINSLTKYAGNQGDVMLGAVGLNADSPFYPDLKQQIDSARCIPYKRDLARLAWEMQSYESTVERVNSNTRAVAAFLQEHPAVDQLWWACQGQSGRNFESISQPNTGPGCMITFTLRKPLEEFYDRVQVVKSPSFGTVFTMLCPFMYLAHYDQASTAEGRKELESVGLPPDLIRLSVGTEPPGEIIARLQAALD